MAGKREAAKQKADEARARLEVEVEALEDPERWQAFLDWASRFHQYSANNVMLIQAQNRHATRVAGFRKWQELGRQVRKGEKGLTILAPRSGPCWDCTPKGAKRGPGCGRCDGKGRVLWFTTATVFDISQTDGDAPPPLPVPRPELLTGGDAGMFDRLAERLTPDGWTVEVGDTGDPEVNGWCRHSERRVMVAADRDPAQQVKTLVHELAHASLHDPADVDYAAERGRCEVEAESVAHVVLGGLGLDTGSYSFSYVAGWASGRTEVLRKAAGRVTGEAHRMLDLLLVDAEQAAEPVAA